MKVTGKGPGSKRVVEIHGDGSHKKVDGEDVGTMAVMCRTEGGQVMRYTLKKEGQTSAYGMEMQVRVASNDIMLKLGTGPQGAKYYQDNMAVVTYKPEEALTPRQRLKRRENRMKNILYVQEEEMKAVVMVERIHEYGHDPNNRENAECDEAFLDKIIYY